jgi:hypothetical protein
MSIYNLPPFGELDTQSLDTYYDVDIDFEGRTIQLDLNFEEDKIGTDRLDLVKSFLAKLSGFNKNNLLAIQEDFDDGDTVEEYIEHHLAELAPEDLAALVDRNNNKVSPEQQLLSKLQLVRVGLYPGSEEQFATFDYSIGQELTNYLVVIFTNEKGEMDYMTMES